MRLRGFTLVELLVVIAIIAVLVSILLPALAGARDAARTAKCLSQIRSLEIASTLYADDHGERFIRAGLDHGGVGTPVTSWVNTLNDYYETPLIVRSPVDDSPAWPISQGGQHAGLTLAEALERLNNDDPSDDPRTAEIARWTSYGLNNYTTNKAPTYRDPRYGPLQSYDRFSRIQRPSATVHFLMMTFGEDGSQGGSDFATSDHVHVDEWGSGDTAPATAAAQMQLNAHGGPQDPSWQGRSNYGFLDGHAETRPFKDVYIEYYDNAFFPEVAQ